MDSLLLKFKQDRKNGLRIEFERSSTGVWNKLSVEQAIKTLKYWTKDLEREFKELDKK